MVAKRSLEERKLILNNLVKDFYASHPQYQTVYNHPAPIYPQSLQSVDLSNKRLAKIGISPIEIGVLCGTCISDSTLKIHSGYANARIQNRHSTRQADWFFWKWLYCLKNYNHGVSSITFQEPDGYHVAAALASAGADETLGKLKISSKACKELTALHTIMCDSRQNKIIKRSWLNHQSNYFLMTVWLTMVLYVIIVKANFV